MINHCDLIEIINKASCFNLQFRKDTRKERPLSPIYYRWNVQFIITLPSQEFQKLKELKEKIGCGTVYALARQTRFCVQNISQIKTILLPFLFSLKKNLGEKKKKDLELWQKAVEIIFRNKRKPLSVWPKSDIYSLIEIYKSSLKYKKRPRSAKWLQTAKILFS